MQFIYIYDEVIALHQLLAYPTNNIYQPLIIVLEQFFVVGGFWEIFYYFLISMIKTYFGVKLLLERSDCRENQYIRGVRLSPKNWYFHLLNLFLNSKNTSPLHCVSLMPDHFFIFFCLVLLEEQALKYFLFLLVS